MTLSLTLTLTDPDPDPDPDPELDPDLNPKFDPKHNPNPNPDLAQLRCELRPSPPWLSQRLSDFPLPAIDSANAWGLVKSGDCWRLHVALWCKQLDDLKIVAL